ncbi:hypothetical protein YC2023_060531 [Brassica napus]|uniref:(rape) hypothetical protein n=1 Tax=Brassica napus TaxID=3708 RepID=A0A816L3U2_BRANA|nr:unnamed protein product [Brassica napus]
MATSFVFIVDWKAGRCNNVVEVRLLRFWEACNDKVDKPPKQSIYCIRPLPFPESSMNVSFVQSQTLGSNGLGDNIHRATSLTSTLSLGHAHNANEPYVDPVAIHPLRLLPPSSNASKKAHRG